MSVVGSLRILKTLNRYIIMDLILFYPSFLFLYFYISKVLLNFFMCIKTLRNCIFNKKTYFVVILSKYT